MRAGEAEAGSGSVDPLPGERRPDQDGKPQAGGRHRQAGQRVGLGQMHEKDSDDGQTASMTHEVDGRQYILIAPGGHHFMETKVGDEVIAYALPEGG